VGSGRGGGQGKATTSAIKALIVEDDEQDAELLVTHLRKTFDLTYQRVQTAEAMAAALDEQRWDIILSDYSMPRFDAPRALQILHASGHDIPFIILSGTVREDIAVACMRAGAHDYFVKGEMGARLIAAIERELSEAQVRAENQRMGEQLMVSDCMASMGTLAAGVAHEINNPLASVMANVNLAAATVNTLLERDQMSRELGEIKEELQDAREAVERIRNIIRDLKIFSRPQITDQGPTDVQKVMESTLRMAWNEVRHRARLVKDYGTTPMVDANESRLGQVFLNLIINAAQSIPEGQWETNKISIKTGTDDTGGALIEVTDTGSGISEDALAHIFQPFFTTKPVGIGTGLGLSICHRIVTDLGGRISVESEVGRGTRFQVRLPRAPATGLKRKLTPALGVAIRHGKVLVVDDEASIGKAVARVLANEHTVVALQSADQALQRMAAGERFDVILCDLLMPQMTGMDFHDALKNVDADQVNKIIFLTGGAFTPRARTFLAEIPNQRIEKPFDPIHLRALINDRIR
jgi:signal transduction histidine kinase